MASPFSPPLYIFIYTWTGLRRVVPQQTWCYTKVKAPRARREVVISELSVKQQNTNHHRKTIPSIISHARLNSPARASPCPKQPSRRLCLLRVKAGACGAGLRGMCSPRHLGLLLRPTETLALSPDHRRALHRHTMCSKMRLHLGFQR